MNFPVCDENLREIERHSLKVDICPGCKGIWLDRRELEKIIEYAVGKDSGSKPAMEQNTFPPQEYHGHAEKHHKHGHHDKHGNHGCEYGHKRKKSWLSNLTDILGD
jgi:Zn-finger nucleic acid-binding protein